MSTEATYPDSPACELGEPPFLFYVTPMSVNICSVNIWSVNIRLQFFAVLGHRETLHEFV